MTNLVNKILTEGRYDSFSRKITNDVFYVIKLSKLEEDTMEYNLPEEISGEIFYKHESGIRFGVDVFIQRLNDVYYVINGEQEKVDFHVNTFIDNSDNIVVEITIDDDLEPKVYENLYYKISEDIRHEIEHYVQELGRKTKRFKERQQPLIQGTSNYESVYAHHMDPAEIEALVHGFYRRAKLEKKPLDVVMWDDLNSDIKLGHITQGQAEDLFKRWVNYARRRLPKAIYSNKI